MGEGACRYCGLLENGVHQPTCPYYVPPKGAHTWMQIGVRDDEGRRTFTIPGDVCRECSDENAGRWVPVSQCPEAMSEMNAAVPPAWWW